MQSTLVKNFFYLCLCVSIISFVVLWSSSNIIIIMSSSSARKRTFSLSVRVLAVAVVTVVVWLQLVLCVEGTVGRSNQNNCFVVDSNSDVLGIWPHKVESNNNNLLKGGYNILPGKQRERVGRFARLKRVHRDPVSTSKIRHTNAIPTRRPEEQSVVNTISEATVAAGFFLSQPVTLEGIDSLFKDMSKKPKLLQLLFVLNGLMYLTWNLLSFSKSGGQQFLLNHFTSSINNLRSNRLWTLLTSAVTHASIYHLASNMITLMMLGPPLLKNLGTQKFATLLFISAAGSSLAAAGWSVFKKFFLTRIFKIRTRINGVETMRDQYEIGFSGVNAALMSAFALSFPYVPMNLLGFVSVTSIDALIMLFSIDVMGLILQNSILASNISHMGHIAGYLIGVAFMMLTGNRDYTALLHKHVVYLTDVVAVEVNRWNGGS
jgi:membrane associated rhomboid family serine protease